MYKEVKNKIGESYTTNQGCRLTIIEYYNYKNCTVQFDNGLIVTNKEYKEVKKGTIKNKLHPSICEVGYLGIGKHSMYLCRTKTDVGVKWTSMINRCYNKKYLEHRPSYKDCYVDERWHNFQNFGDWFEENYNPKTMEGWHLDKDILVKENKIYSPETCCFVPQEINSLFNDKYTGIKKTKYSHQARVSIYGKCVTIGSYITFEEAFQAYKETKEKYIKEVAEKWRELISEKVYQALINYQVEIID